MTNVLIVSQSMDRKVRVWRNSTENEENNMPSKSTPSENPDQKHSQQDKGHQGKMALEHKKFNFWPSVLSFSGD